jgi:hypothetical protein
MVCEGLFAKARCFLLPHHGFFERSFPVVAMAVVIAGAIASVGLIVSGGKGLIVASF